MTTIHLIDRFDKQCLHSFRHAGEAYGADYLMLLAMQRAVPENCPVCQPEGNLGDAYGLWAAASLVIGHGLGCALSVCFLVWKLQICSISGTLTHRRRCSCALGGKKTM